MTTESGDQTFLFADLAGFTALTEAHGDETAVELVGDFCDRARALLPEHGAEEVKAIGDALMVRIPRAEEGVRLALRLTHEVGGHHGFPGVRVGAHTGPAITRGNDWFGATVNLASRVSGAASAGEVLVTRATRDASAAAAGELEFRSRGPARFKNLTEPVELFVVGAKATLPARRLPIDPVCQMAVDPAEAAASFSYRGRDYHFCSLACAEVFEARPEHFHRRSPTSDLLVSDVSRELAARLLKRAYARGRLETEELEERVAHAHAARTRGELRAVLHDLPEYRRWRRGQRRQRFWRALFPFRRRR